mmetsp:Transcript_67990/g.175241  ORF Transcript_67990/g.175241 Transcript_67990/m.175241 type:complete len:221 (-) Transcript_67990:519-1181(-)
MLGVRVNAGEDIPERRVRRQRLTRRLGPVAVMRRSRARRVRGGVVLVAAVHLLHEELRLLLILGAAEHTRQCEDVNVVLSRAVVGPVGRQVAKEALQAVVAGASGPQGMQDVPCHRRVARTLGRRRVVREGQGRPGIVAAVHAAIGHVRRLIVASLWPVRRVVGTGQESQCPPGGDALVERLGRARPQCLQGLRVEERNQRIEDPLRRIELAAFGVIDGR